ncbi:hypothetical protein [Nocardia sp. NPDC127526]|uniref:DUF7373 family lipoprotein n=1 Tax=Nocardia sp. NPDC127526 TaxID=3345393 RepID=UPI00363AFBC1
MLYNLGRAARVALAAGASFLLMATAACGSESNAAGEQSVDLAKLDVGNYPTQPQEWAPEDRSEAVRIVEALRLGDVMPLAEEVDPALKYPVAGTPYTKPGKSTGGTMFGWLNKDDFASNTPGLIAAFGSAAGSNLDRGISTVLINNVLLFETDEAATSAAASLARSGFADTKGRAVEPGVSAQYPTASVMWIPDFQVLASVYATGKFVIIEVVQDNVNRAMRYFDPGHSDQSVLVALADKATSVTIDRLKAFEPTPPSSLAELPLDPEGMQRITLRSSGTIFTGVQNDHGALHNADGLDNRSRALYDDAGVEYVSVGAGELTRARDSDAAVSLALEYTRNRLLIPADSPRELPGARCVKYRGPLESTTVPYYCTVAVGRYAARVWSSQLPDAHQQIAAQYAILVNGK